jgi:hypothetical protein
MGYRHDAAGAAAAALSFTRLSEALVDMSEAEAVAAWRVMSSDAAAGELVERMRGRLVQLRERWAAGSLLYRVAPLGVRVEADGADAADVEVWYVGLVAARDVAPYEEWATDIYRLVWERGDWRVAAFSDSPGPRPAAAQQTPAPEGEIEAHLTRFGRVP